MFTDNNGHFTATKRFKHKVKVVVKFKNQYCTLRRVRGVRVWQTRFPVEKVLGVYSGNKNNISYNFTTGTEVSSKARQNWAASSTLNGVQEHADYAAALSFSAAPNDLNIYLTKNKSGGSSPLFHKRQLQTLPIPYVNTMLISDNMVIAGGIIALTTNLRASNIDMTIGYYTSGVPKSDALKETIYHEMSHVSHYSRAGTGFYTLFVDAELNEISLHFGGSSLPYGTGSDSYGPIIAVGEGWAYFMGHFLTDRRYTTNCSAAVEQGISYTNNSPVTGLSSHLNLLEDFSPNRTADVFRWIPQGLMYDLMDTRNETGIPIIDGVSGFTISQLFNPLQSDIMTLPQYKARLQLQNPGNQTVQITNLFAQYGY